MELLTRKYGPLPGWAWAAIAAAGAFAFWYFRGRSSSTSAATQSTGSVVNNPAASSIPYVPSVTVTGIPASTTAPSTPATSSPGAVWQFGAVPSGQQTVWSATPSGQAHFQQVTGGAWPGGVRPGRPDPETDKNLGYFGWQWATVPSGSDANSFAAQLNQSGQGGGQGGWGYAGGMAPSGAVGGWTVGWQPAAAGPGQGGPSAANRNRVAGSRLLPGKGGGSSSRTRSAPRPLKRRSFSGR